MAEIDFGATLAKLGENRQKTINFIAAEIAKNPALAKATQDLQLLNEQIEKVEAMEKAAKEEPQKDLPGAVKKVTAIFEEGKEPTDEEFAEIAKEFEVEVSDLEDAVADELGKD